MNPLPEPDDPSAADAARAKLESKKSFASFFKSRKAKQKAKSIATLATASFSQADPSEPSDTIEIFPNVDTEDPQPEYRWVALYENQRGLKIFSIPYFSRLSLLPFDPYPFTIPSASHSRSNQPNVSLDSYPLPDGTWSWVSKTWMIDMRSDSGEVQHDGFEYNWIFRSKKWQPQIGPFSCVRRRRWIRLMMRRPPTCKHKPRPDGDSSRTPATATTGLFPFGEYDPFRHRLSVGSSFPPSILTGVSELGDGEELNIEFDEVWQGDIDLDWARCKIIMKHLATDGRRLEVWKKWLGFQDLALYPPRRVWTEDEQTSHTESPVDMTASRPVSQSTKTNIDYIAAVVNKYGDAVFHLFVFPESRARLLQLLGAANVLPDFSLENGHKWTSVVDFHSYASGLGSQ